MPLVGAPTEPQLYRQDVAELPLPVKSMLIRNATVDDAQAACALVRRSITELCVCDHQNDPAILDKWLGNKTPENMARWFSIPGQLSVVAELEGVLAGIGILRETGEVMLLYVSPESRFAGVSKSILECLESHAASLGVESCFLDSTVTARGFYERRGYRVSGKPKEDCPCRCVPMMKKIAA